MAACCNCSNSESIPTTTNFAEKQFHLTVFDKILLTSVSLYFLGLCLFVIDSLFIGYLVNRRRATDKGLITREPLVPSWSSEPRNVEFLDSGIRVETCHFEVQKCCNLWNRSQGAIDWIQSIISKYHGARIPKSSCIISVPMDCFQCTPGSPTDFQPSRGPSSESHLTYQMYGANIQVTRYVERGVAYVAGYCIYISHPYQYSWGFSRNLIEECYKGPKYHLKPTALILVTVDETDSECLQESEVRRILERLKSNYCKILQKPVLIGADSGVLKHFEWDHVAKRWKIEDCDKCAYQELSEDPPAYHLLDF